MSRCFGRVLVVLVALISLGAQPLLAATGTYRATVLADNPAAYYPLDEASGPTAVSQVGAGTVNGTYNSVTLGNPGALGSATTAGTFNGSSSYISLPGTWNPGSALTIEAWVKIAGSTGQPQTIVGATSTDYVSLNADIGNTEYYIDGGGPQSLGVVPGTNAWQHVVVVIQSGSSRLYIDGTQVSSNASTFTSIDAAFSNLRIGMGQNPGRYVNGLIDEVAIYNYALSPARITAHFNAQLDGPITSVASGNWSSASTWSTGTVPTTTGPGGLYDNVVIDAAHTVTVDTGGVFVNDLSVLGTLELSSFGITVRNDATVDGTINGSSYLGLVALTAGTQLGGSGTINAPVGFSDTGLTRTITSSAALTFTNTVDVDSSSTVLNAGAVTLTHASGLTGTGTWNQGSTGTLHIEGPVSVTNFNASAGGNTVDFTGATQQVRSTTYHHVLASGNFETRTLAGPITVNGNLTIQGGFHDDGQQITGGAGTLSLGNFAELQIGTYNGPNSGNGTSLPAFGSYVLDPDSDVSFDALAGQTVASTPVYGNLAINAANTGGTYTKTANGTINVAGSLSVFEFVSDVVFDLGSFSLNVAGDLEGGGVINLGAGTVTIEGSNTSFTGTITPSYAITFAGENFQSIRGTTYDSLTINKASNTAVLTGATTATFLTLAAGELFDGNNVLTSNGTVNLGAGTTLRIAATMPLGTQITDPDSYVVYEGDGNQTISTQPVYGHLHLLTANTNAVKTPDGPTLYAADIFLGSTGTGTVTLDLSGKTGDVEGNIAGTGDVSINLGLLNIGGNLTFAGAFDTTSSNVTYDGTGAQLVRGAAYEDLTIDKSAGTATLAGNVSVADELFINDGTLNLGSYALDSGDVVLVDTPGTLELNTGILKISAYLIIDGAFNGGTTGEIWSTASSWPAELSGASTAAISLPTLRITGAAGMELDAFAGFDLTVTNLVDLSGGGNVVLETPRKLTIGTAGSINRVAGAVQGLLAFQIPAGQTRRYETATQSSNTYSPIEITSTNAATINVLVTDASATQKVDRFWTLSGDPSTLDLKFEWDYSGYTGDTRGFVPARYSGATWSFPAGYVDVTGSPSFFALVEGVTSYDGDWTAGYAGFLGAVVPSIGSFDPVLGSNGTSVTLYGSNFTGTTAVLFNGVSDPGFSQTTDNELYVTVPAGATTGTISVTNGSGTGTSFNNFTVAAASTITTAAPGNWSSTATWQGGVVPNAWDNVVINHAVSVNVSATANDVQLNANLVASTGFLTVDGTMSWNSGTITSGLNLSSGATLDVLTAASHELSGATLNNDGTINLSASLFLSNGASLNNDGTVNIVGDYNLVYNSAGSMVQIENNDSGSIIKTGGAGTGSLGGGAELNNIGVIRAASGTLHITSDVTTAGLIVGDARTGGRRITTNPAVSQSFEVANGATLQFTAGGTFENGTDFTGSGTILFTSAVEFKGNISASPTNFIIDANVTTTWTASTFFGTLTAWKQGTFTGALTNAGGSTITAATGAGSRTLDNINFHNEGTFNLDASVILTNGAAVTNDGANINLQGDYTLVWNAAGSTPVIQNDGTITKTAGAGTAEIGGGATFSSSDTLRSQSGTLRVSSPGIIAGFADAANAGNTVEFNTVPSFADEITFSGNGTILINSGATFTGDVYQTADLCRIDTSGAITFTGVTFNGHLEWKDASFGGDALIINGGSVWDVIAGPGTPSFDGLAVTNNGVFNLAGDSVALANAASFTNQLTVDIQGDFDFRWNGAGAAPAINNNSTIKKTAGNGTSVLGNGATFTNSSAVQADTGTLSVSSAASGAGSYTAASGATIEFPSTANFGTGTIFGGLGTIDVRSNAVFNGSITGGAGTTLLRGTANAMTFNGATFTGPLTWKEASLNGSGLTIPIGSTLTVNSGTGTPKLDAGTLTIDGDLVLNTHLGMRNGPTFSIGSTGSATIAGDFTLGYDGVGALPSVTLSGELLKTAGTGIASMSCGGVCTNSATGTLGAAIGTLSFISGLTSNGTIRFEIDGPTPLVNFGRIAVSGGALTLAGTADAFVDAGYTPDGGTAFQVMTFTSKSGDFVTKNYTFAGVRTLVDTYTASDLTLTVSGPVIGTISPTSGSAAGGTAVTITGSGFTGTTPGENFTGTVTFDGVAATPVLWQSATQLTATTPAHVAATVDVTVTNANSEADTLVSGYTYGTGSPPTIATLSVNTGTPNGGTYVEITGTNLSTVTQVQFGPSNATILSATASLLKVRTPAGGGTVNVIVTNPDGSDTELSAFTYSAPGCDTGASGVVSWYRMEGNTNDGAGANDGTPVGTTSFTSAKSGQGLVLDSDDDGVTINHTTQLDVGAGFTVEFWMQGIKNQPGSQFLVVDKSHGFIDSKGWAMQGFGATGVLHFLVGRGGAGTIDFGDVATSDVLDGQLHHVAGVYDGANIAIYVDGLLQASAPLGGTPSNNTRPVNVGYAWGGGTPQRFYRGLVDELTIHNRALSAVDILAIYDADDAGKCYPAIPTVTSISPSSGTTAGGTSVTIKGSSLSSASVTIGNALSIGSNTQSQIDGTTVATGAGTYNVNVTTAAGTGQLLNGFTFGAAATFTSVTSGAWNNPATWGVAGFPGPGDTAVVNHDVTVDSNRSVNTLTINGSGTRLSGSSTLTVTSALTWNGGDIVTPLTIDTGATANITGSVNRYVMANVTNDGTVNFDATGQFTLHTFNFTNNGIFNLQNDATWLRFNAPAFINSATSQWNKTGGAGSASWAGTFTNNGTMTLGSGNITFTEEFNNANAVNVNAGSLILSGTGTDSGTFTTAATTTVNYVGGAHTFSGSQTGAGKLVVAGGAVTMSGSPTINNFSLTGGSIEGTATLTVANAFHWTGGDVNAPTSLGASCTTTITGAAARSIQDPVVNNGTINQDATGAVTLHTFNFTNYGTFNLQSDGAWVRFNGPTFTNASGGQFNKNGGAGAANWDVTFVNDGTMSITSGGMSFTEAFSNSNTVNINTGVLNLGSGGTSSGTFATGVGTGILEYSAGNSTLSGTLTGNGKLLVSGGQLDISGGTASTGNFHLTGGLVDGLGTLTVTNTFTWNGGDLSNAGGTIALGLGSSTTITGAAARTLGRALTNQGTITYNATGGLTVHTANLTNSGTIDLQVDGAWSRFNGPVILNTGTIKKTAGAGTFTMGVGVDNSGGIIDVESGTIAFTEPQTASVSSHYKFGVSSALAAGTMTFTGAPAIGGSQLTAYIVGAYDPPAGQTWTVMSPVTGTFGTTNTSFGAGRSFAVDYPGGNSVRLTASGPTITSVNPTSGSELGGDTVVITGTNFTNPMSVTFATTSAASVVFDSATQLTVVTPAHASGAVNVTVTNASTESATLTNGFTYSGDPHWANTAGGNWNTAANWSTGAVPTSGQTAYIDATGTYTVTFSGADHTVASLVIASGATLDVAANTLTVSGNSTVDAGGALVLSGGTLAGAGTITVNGGMNWSGGTLGTAVTIAPAANLAITGAPAKVVIAGAVLTNNGTVTVSGNGAIGGASGVNAVINNTGTWNQNADVNFQRFSTPATVGTFNNSGTFNKSGAGTTTFDPQWPFNSTAGAINVNAGTLMLTEGGSASGGAYTIAGGATLTFGDSFTASGATTFTGAGTVNFAGGTSTMVGYSVQNTAFNGGTGTFNDPTTTTTLTLASGTLAGTGPLTVTSPSSNWSGGTLGGGLVVDNGATLAITGAGGKSVVSGASLTNNGTVTVSGSGAIGGFTGANAIINNAGTWNHNSDAAFQRFSTPATVGTFYNSGTFNKSGAGTTTFDPQWPFNSAGGAINVNAGTLTLSQGGGATGGAYTIASGATLIFGDSFTASGTTTFTGSGTVDFAGGTSTMIGYSVQNTTFSGGTGTFNAPTTTSIVTISGGTLAGAGSLTATGAGSTWTGGTLAGTLILDTGATLDISGTGSKSVATGAVLTNNGTVTVSGSGAIGGASGANAVFTNAGTWNHNADAQFQRFSTPSPVGTINNNGTFNKNGSGTTTLDPQWAFNNGGTLNIAAGTLNFGGASFTQTAAGTLTVNANGTTAGTQYSRLTSSSPVTLDGTLTITTGYTPGNGDALQILTFASRAGDFATKNGLSYGSGTWGYAANATDVTITAATAPASYTATQNGNWSSSATWGGAGVPGPSDTATNNAFTVTVDAAVSVANLNLGGGTLTGTSPLTVTGTMNWTGGTISGAGTLSLSSGSILNINGSANKVLIERTINNAGTATWSGIGNIQGGLGAVFNNQAGATFTIQGDVPWFYNYGGVRTVFNNSGTLTKNTTPVTTLFMPELNNDNAVSVQTGMLTLDGGGTSNGLFTVASGATLGFGSAAHVLNAAATISGAGTIRSESGSVTVNGTYAVTGPIAVAGGVLTLNGTVSSLGTPLTITNGTIAFNSGSLPSLTDINLSNGTITGTSAIGVSGTFTWTGGEVRGTGTLSLSGGSILNISGSIAKVLIERTINNAGTATWSDVGTIQGGLGAVFNNQAGGTFTIQTDAYWHYNFGGVRTVFNNSGTLTKNTTTGISVLMPELNNNNVLSVQTGTLTLDGGGTSNGSFTAAAGTTIGFSGAAHVLNAPATIAGAGAIRSDGGSVTVNGTYALTGPITVAGGAIALNGTVSSVGTPVTVSSGTMAFNSGSVPSLTDITLSDGTLTGTSALTVTGTLAWTGGTISGAGSLALSSGSFLNINGAAAKIFTQRTINNSGTATWSDAGNLQGGLGAVFNNQSGGTFTIQNDVPWHYNYGGTRTVFNNSGTLTKNTTAGTTLFMPELNNNNVVSVQTGTLTFDGGGTSNGSFTAAAGTIIGFSGAAHVLNAPATISGAGGIRSDGGSVTVNGTYALTGPITVGGGAIALNGTVSSVGTPLTVSSGVMTFNSASVPSLTDITMSDGTFTGTSALTVTGTLAWTGGTISGTGSLSLNSGSFLNITGSAAKILTQRTINNAGTTTWSGVGTLQGGLGAVFNNQAGGSFNIQNDVIWHYNYGGVATVFNNAGTLTKTAGTGVTTFHPAITNSGLIDLQAGSLAATAGYTQTAPGTLRLRIGGLTPETQFSRLQVTGLAALAGTLDLNLGAYTPNDNDTFQIITFGSRSGDFATKSGLTYTGGTFSYGLNANDITLTAAASDAAVSITKTAPANVAANQGFTYTITVTNAGPDPATTVSVTDVMQASMTPSNISAPSFTCTGTATLTCTAATLATGTHTITFDVTAPSSSQAISNVANLSAANDSTPGDNTSTAVTNVGSAQADLAVTTTASAASVPVNTSFTWTATVTNNGPSPATNVVLTDTLPAGQTVTGTAPSTGSCSVAGSVVTCNFGNLASGNSANVVITATADVGGTRMNQATATATETDGNGANNVGTATVAVTGSSTMVVTTNNPAGTGTLERAILDANSGVCTAPCTIVFNIGGSTTIPATLSTVTVNQLTIDATTQPGYVAGAPVVVLDGSAQIPGTHGLVISGSNNVIKGLSITGYTDGIRVTGSTNTVTQNLIANNVTGVSLPSGSGNRVIGNSIHSNAGMPVDHDGDGVAEVNDATDVDGGANGHQNSPVISLVELNPGSLDVTFSVDSFSVLATNAISVEVYKADGSGEPKELLGSQCFPGRNLVNQLINLPLGSVVAGNTIVATATSYLGAACTNVGDGTSEVSAGVTAGSCVPPAVAITGASTMCPGGSVTLDAGTHSSYLWTPGNFTTQTIAVSPASTTTYSVTVTDGSGCANSTSHTVTVNSAPPVTITGPAASCNGNSVTLNATAGFASYLWQPGNLTGPSITVTPGSTTNYTLTATAANGCQSSTNHTVTVTTSAPATATASGPTTFCDGGSVVLTASAGASYQWLPNGETSSSIAVTASGTYSVIVTDGSGCTSTSNSITVTVNPVPNVTITGPAATCDSAPVTLDAGSGFATYLWQPGNLTTQSITVSPSSTTTYTVTVTTGAGCTDTDTHTVSVSSNPVAVITAPTAVCSGTTGHAASVGTQPGATYTWAITNGSITSGAGTAAITFQPTGLSPVQLNVTVAAGSCTATGNTTVQVSQTPSTPAISAPASVTASTSGHVASVTPQAGATYAWSISGGTIDSGNGTSTITFSSGNSSPISLGVSVNVNGCIASAAATVVVDNLPPPADEADLSVSKTAPPSVTAGSNFTYTIGVSNAGPAAAVNLTLTDALPAGLTVVSFDAGGWSCGTSFGAFNCSLPSMSAGSFSTITLTVQAPSQAANLVNTVTVGSAVADPLSFNNTASASTSVVVAPPSCPAAAPSLLAPANGATVNSPVTLSWSAVSGATTYDVWTSTEGTLILAGSTATTSMTLNTGSGVTTWYVVAHGGSNCDALTSATRTFTVQPSSTCGNVSKPQVTAPTSPIVSSPVTFGWTPVPQAIGYRVWISVNGAAPEDIGTTNGPISLTAAVPPGAIVVFVDALFNACPPSRSEGYAFEVSTPDPCAGRGTATLTTPANNSQVNSSSVELRWNAAPAVNGQAAEYRVWASKDGGPFEVRGTTTDTSLRDTFERGTIVWYVQALYAGCPSTDSPRFTFTIPAASNCGTSRPTLIAPNGTTVTGGNVTFLWSGAAEAIGYELYLALGNETASLIATTGAGVTSFNYNVPEGTLTWFVRALIDRCPSRDSLSATFTYAPPSACATNDRPQAIGPLEGSPITSPAGFSWSAPAGAVRYELYLQRGNSAPSLIASTTAPAANGVELQNGAHSWFVRAFFNGCSPLDSAPETIAVVPPPAACNDLTPPVVSAPGQISSGAEFLIQWTPIAGATSYQLQLASTADFAGADTVNTTGTQHSLVRTNNGNATTAVYARVRAIDSRCAPQPTVTPYGPVSAVFILPPAGSEGSAPIAKKSNVAFTIDLGPELAGQSFVATPNQPWLTVTPASGVVPAAGRTLIVTADTADLFLGANLGAVTVTLNTPGAKVTTAGFTTVTSPVSVNLVTPVTPAAKNSPPPDALVIPAVANASGINSKFQSDVRVSNTSAQVQKYQLTYTPSGDSGLSQGRQTTFSIEPGRTVALDDVLKSWFGTGSTSSTGMLEVRPMTQTASSTPNVPVGALANLVTFASSRTFNVTANGTFGQHIPAVPFANFIGKSADLLKPTTLSLQQIAQSDKYRTNLGLVEGSGEPAQLLVKVFGSTGLPLAQFPVNLNGGQHLQMNSVLAQQGISNLNDGRLEIAVTGGNGKITAYASVLDSQTSDPLLVSPVTLSDTGNTRWVVPGVADLNNGVANWQTDLRVFNAGTTDVETTLAFYSQNGGEPRTATMNIAAGQVLTLDKTLSTVFGASNDGGAVHITTATGARLIATARTYNQTTQGTYGQFISAVTPLEAAALGTRPLQLLQVEESNRFRSNIGLAEVTGNPVKLEISVVPPDAKFTAVAEVTLAANEFRQIGSLLKTVGLSDTYNARVTVRVIEGTGRVAAYASVIDALTNDPTYVPAQ